jgi:hypothetical protein
MNLYRVYTYRNDRCYQCFINAVDIDDAKEKTEWLPQDDTNKGKQVFKILKPSKIGIENAFALEEFHKASTRYIHGDSIEKWNYIKLPKEKDAINKIVELREKGNKVKCGYFTTAIRNYHDRIILWKRM